MEYMQFDPSKLTDEQALDLHLKAERYKAQVKADAQREAQNEVYRRQQADADAAKQEADRLAKQEQLAHDRSTLIRPDTFEAYASLDAAAKACYIEAYGSGFVSDLRSKERFGMSWDAYDNVSTEIAARKAARQGSTSSEVQGASYAEQRKAAERKQYLQYRSRPEEFSDEALEEARIAVEKGYGRSK